MLTGDNKGYLSCCGEQGYPVATLPGGARYPVNNDGQPTKPKGTIDTCLAGAAYLEL